MSHSEYWILDDKADEGAPCFRSIISIILIVAARIDVAEGGQIRNAGHKRSNQTRNGKNGGGRRPEF